MSAVVEILTAGQVDRVALRALFDRAGAGSPTASLWGHPDSEAAMYLDPYVEREPDSLFVALVGGHPVGYLTGCPDTGRFPGEDEVMVEVIKRFRLYRRPGPLRFLARAALDSARGAIRREPSAGAFHDPRWPAHLHLNVAPEARGTGVADALVARWFERLREIGSPGCHLRTLCENTRAIRFFGRVGFVGHGPTPPVPGLRHEGARVRQRTMVWSP